ncbi:LysM domain-containing protein 9 [Elsinoe fawcettii]|nr:LysM domain-containing protein 9 [Elsinoe fawcettii]
MRVISSLVVLALTGGAIAGPLGHGKHGKLHRRDGRKHPGFHYIHANTTTSAIGTGSDGAPTSSIAEPYPADTSLTNPMAPTTSASKSPVLVPVSNCGGEGGKTVVGKATETQTKTITSTLTYTVTDGPSTYVTTSTKVEIVKVIIEYSTIFVPGQNSPAPTSPATSGGNSGSSTEDTVPVDGESVPSTPIKNGNGNGSGNGSGSDDNSGNFPSYGSDNGSGSGTGSGSGSRSDSGNGSGNGSGSGSGSGSDSGSDDGSDDNGEGGSDSGSGSSPSSPVSPPYPTNLPTYPNGTSNGNSSYPAPVSPGVHYGATKKTKKTKKTKTSTKANIKTTKSKAPKTTTTTTTTTTKTKRRHPSSSPTVIVDPISTVRPLSSLTTRVSTTPRISVVTTPVVTTSSRTLPTTSSAANGVPPPNQTGAGTVSGCQKWYTPVSGDWCSKVADANGISVSDFISWNPSVGTDCTTMYVGWSYCVAIKVGGAATTKATTPAQLPTTSRSTTKAVTTPSTTKPVTTPPATTPVVTTRAQTTSNAAPSSVPTPSPVRDGTVQGCTKWDLVVSGDDCSVIGARNGVSSANIITWNPAVGSNCGGLWLGYYACVGVSSSGSTNPTTPAATTTPRPSSTSNPSPGAYNVYRGSGSVSDGWPAQSKWLNFDDMWTLNLPNIGTNCAWMTDPSGKPVVANTQQETSDLRAAIVKVADKYSLPRSYVLAIVQQESNGCVRVHTTFNPVRNPGLMQTHNGAGTCNDKSQNLLLSSPQCTSSIIEQMVIDGVNGTPDGDGLVQTLVKSGYQSSNVAMYYAGARIYNGGEAGGAWDRTNLAITAGTKCYASDVANRLTGWAQGSSGCEAAAAAGTL